MCITCCFFTVVICLCSASFFSTDCYFGLLELWPESLLAKKSQVGGDTAARRALMYSGWVIPVARPDTQLPVTIRGKFLLQKLTTSIQTGMVAVHTCLNHSFPATE